MAIDLNRNLSKEDQWVYEKLLNIITNNQRNTNKYSKRRYFFTQVKMAVSKWLKKTSDSKEIKKGTCTMLVYTLINKTMQNIMEVIF